MMKRPFSYVSIVAVSGFLLVSFITEAGQLPPSAAQPQPPGSVSQDPVSWRRDPFTGSLKKGDGLTAAKTMSLKNGTGTLKEKFEQEQSIQLQGIMQSDRAFHALINGRTVKAGDTIDGVTINKISRYQVVVLNERKEKIIYDIYQGKMNRGKQ